MVAALTRTGGKVPVRTSSRTHPRVRECADPLDLWTAARPRDREVPPPARAHVVQIELEGSFRQ